MKICFCSNASPWFFGPYGKQLKYLCEYFLKNNNYNVYYILLGNYTLPNNDSKIKYISNIKSINYMYLISDINKSLLKNNIDKLFFLSDLTNLCFDEEFKIPAFIWYPNHFAPINNVNREKLSYFHHIISLCETDKKQLQELYHDKSISMVPHIIDVEKPNNFNKSNFRKEISFSDNDFIIFMNIGNYDTQNRKSLDTALFAFNDFVKNYKNAILFIHTYDVRKIDVDNKFTPKDNFFEIDDLLTFLDIPSKNIRIINDIIQPNLLVKYYLVSDVYLQTSKSEGFGLPVLEAQKLGIPVITTDWGAMGDYNYNGIKVPPCQPLYDHTVRGIWCMPSIKGVLKALIKIYNNNYENNSEEAVLLVTKNMSKTSVSSQIEKILTQSLIDIRSLTNNTSSKPLQTISYDDNFYYMNDKEYDIIKPIQITSKWVMLIHKNAIISKKKITNLCNTYKTSNIVGFITKFNNVLFPNDNISNNISNNSEPMTKMNYIIKSDIVKTLIGRNILVKNMKGFILINSMNKSNNCTFVKEVLCIENINI